MQEEKKDIEQILKNGTPVGFYPQGNSMHPTIVQGRDSVIVEPLEDRKIRRVDVLLFRRPKDAPRYPGMLVLHRVWKAKKEGIYMVGDNEKQVEGPLNRECFLGIMTELNRKGSTIRASNLFYIFLTGSWLLIRPIRFIVTKPLKIFKRNSQKTGDSVK